MEETPGGWPTDWGSKSRGISLAGLRLVVEMADGRSSARLWREVWMTDCAPPGWTAEAIFDDAGTWRCDRLTHLETGEAREKVPHDLLGATHALVWRTPMYGESAHTPV